MNAHSLAETYSGKCIVQAHVRPLKWSLFISLFVVASVALPLVAHQFSPQVGRMLLPMHFFALTAGVVMGWRAGLVVGAASPIVSFLLSGLPAGPSLGILTAEIAVYGLLAGLLQARFKNLWISLIGAAIAGRIVLFAGAALLTPRPLLAYVGAVLLVGLPGLLAQLVLIPPLSRKLCSWLNQKS